MKHDLCLISVGQSCSQQSDIAKAPLPHYGCTRVVLQCIPFIPEAQAVLDLVDQLPEQVHKGKFPVIAFEGLDATGNITFQLQARRDIDLSWE